MVGRELFSARSFIAFAVPILMLLAFASMGLASAVTTLTAYQSQHGITLDGIVQPGEWNDTSQFTDPISTLTVAFKQNGTGLMMLMIWHESSKCRRCYAALQFDTIGNSQHMGSDVAPALIVVVGPAVGGGVDEVISTGIVPPTPVERRGYKTQSVAGLNYSNGEYTGELYRPFKSSGASPYLKLNVGSAVEIGFAVGNLAMAGSHLATDMTTYVLSISSQTYPSSVTTTSSSSTASVTSTSILSSSSSVTTTSSSSTASVTSTSILSSASATSTAPSSSIGALSFSYDPAEVAVIVIVVIFLLAAAKEYRRSS